MGLGRLEFAVQAQEGVAQEAGILGGADDPWRAGRLVAVVVEGDLDLGMDLGMAQYPVHVGRESFVVISKYGGVGGVAALTAALDPGQALAQDWRIVGHVFSSEERLVQTDGVDRRVTQYPVLAGHLAQEVRELVISGELPDALEKAFPCVPLDHGAVNAVENPLKPDCPAVPIDGGDQLGQVRAVSPAERASNSFNLPTSLLDPERKAWWMSSGMPECRTAATTATSFSNVAPKNAFFKRFWAGAILKNASGGGCGPRTGVSQPGILAPGLSIWLVRVSRYYSRTELV